MRLVSDIAFDDPEVGEFLRVGLGLAHATPSAYVEASPEQLRRLQRWKNHHLKLAIKIKRRYDGPVKPLPLP
jgi:hypothetical protein